MDLTIYGTLLPREDPDASPALCRDLLGVGVRRDAGGCVGMHWTTGGPADQPGTSVVRCPPAATPGLTDDERRALVATR